MSAFGHTLFKHMPHEQKKYFVDYITYAVHTLGVPIAIRMRKIYLGMTKLAVDSNIS